MKVKLQDFINFVVESLYIFSLRGETFTRKNSNLVSEFAAIKNLIVLDYTER